MKVLVAYDSSFGNTEKIAQAISSGMKEVGLTDVICKRADATGPEDFKQADAWIIGSPTHLGSPTGEVKKALKIAFRTGRRDVKGAAFDTRYAKTVGGACGKIQSMMEKEGIKILLPAEWYVITKAKGPLAEGEEAKAVSFGRRIAGSLRPS
ncbi:MAG: flavodoxin domain-containing protein [Methanomassiliicoccales archaeon]